MRLPVKFIHRLAHIAVIAFLSWVPMSLAIGVRPAAAQVESVSVEFRTALEPYGSFQRVAHWGEVWVPNVAHDWRPYTVGRWVYSADYGWYWASDAPEAPWGWIAFHYGRWVWIEDIGWAWVAGREWGPAWVDWRRGGGYVGWAPLPPDEVVVEIRDEPQYWVFCRPTDFLVTNVATVFIEPEPVLLRETVVVNETVVINGRGFAVNPGIEPAFIAASIGRPIPEYQVRPRIVAGTAGPRERGTIGTTPEQQRGLPQRGANEPGPGQERRLYNRGETGLAPGEQRGQREPGPVSPTPEQQRSLRDRGASGPAIEQQRQIRPPSEGPASRERGATGSSPGQERQLFNRAPASPAPGPQRGAGERGPSRPAPAPGGRDQRRNFEQER